MNIYFSMVIVMSTMWISISSDKIKAPIITDDVSNKYPDRELRNINQVCTRYKGNICGVGVFTPNTNNCVPWGTLIGFSKLLYSDTTICSTYQSTNYHCLNSFRTPIICPLIKCINIDPDVNICQDKIYWSSTASSIRIDFFNAIAPQKHEILIILSSLDINGRVAKCSITKICRGQCSLISRFYQVSCTNVPDTIYIYNNESAVVTFADLTPNTNQILYLMQVIDNDTIGSVVTTLRMKTRLPVVVAPSNITIMDKSSTTIQLGWIPTTKSANYGPPEGYQVTMNGGDRIINTTTNYIVFGNLTQCRPHCFVVASFNKAGRSADSARICTNTTIEFEKVELSPTVADFPMTRLVSWRYLGVNMCPVVFEIQYAASNDYRKALAVLTSAYNIQLNGLETDQIYSVKVRPYFDGKYGEYSPSKDFHTFRIPNIPPVLTIYKKTTSYIKLTWTPSKQSDKYGPVQGYRVSMTMGYSNKSLNTPTNNIVFNNLSQCTQHCFVVASFNMAGRSADSKSICTNTEADFQTVDQLKVKFDFPDKRNVSWRYNNVSQCPVVFELHYSKGRNNSSTIITTTNDREIQLQNIAIDQIYEVKVRPKHNSKYGLFSSSIEFHTFRKPMIPTGVTIVKVSPTTVCLQWQKPRKIDTFGSAQKYYITIYNNSMTLMNSTSMESHHFNNLQPFSKYCFTVAAYNLAGMSNHSHPICDNTTAEPMMPSDVRIVKTMPTTISLQWKKYDKTHPARQYIVTIYNITGRAMYNTSMESHDFNNLRQCSYYCFTVAANNLAGSSNESYPICGNTSTDFDEVKLLPAKSQFSTSQTITWTYSNTYKCNIVFHVQYFMKNHQNQVFSNETSDTQIRLDNLSTNDIYVVRVQPMIGIWEGQFSTNRELFTNNANPIIKDIQIYSYKNDISISWTIDTRKSAPNNMILLKISNTANDCLYLVTLICSTCQYQIDESIMNTTQKDYLREMNGCIDTKNETFHKDQVQFSITIPTNGSAINGTLVIYSVNAIDIYELRTQYFYLDFKSREKIFAQQAQETTNLKLISNVKSHLGKFESLIREYINKLYGLLSEV